MRKFIPILVITFAIGIMSTSMTNAQSPSAVITCTPVQQFSKIRTQIECRMVGTSGPEFLTSEFAFPFHITKLVKVSSSFAATIGMLYPATLTGNTVFVAPVEWGDPINPPHFHAVPFDTLSLLLETDQSMSDLKRALAAGAMTVSFLTPNSADPANPLAQTLIAQLGLQFDSSLILESITQYVSPSVLQFLRLGVACYEKQPQECFTNIAQGL